MGRKSAEKRLAVFVITGFETHHVIPGTVDADRAEVCSRMVARNYYNQWLLAGYLAKPYGKESQTLSPGNNWFSLRAKFFGQEEKIK